MIVRVGEAVWKGMWTFYYKCCSAWYSVVKRAPVRAHSGVEVTHSPEADIVAFHILPAVTMSCPLFPLQGCWKPAPVSSAVEFQRISRTSSLCLRSFPDRSAAISGVLLASSVCVMVFICYHHILLLQLTLGSRWGVCVCVRVFVLQGRNGRLYLYHVILNGNKFNQILWQSDERLSCKVTW